MAIDSKHPDYSTYITAWTTMRDCYDGQDAVKAKGGTYLPPTTAMKLDGAGVPNTPGHEAYTAYLTRAVFHDYVHTSVEKMIGVMHHKPPTIDLPPQLDQLRTRATPRGESLDVLLRRVNEAQLTTGRIGLLADIPKQVPTGVLPLPYIVTYKAEDIINWDEGRVTDDKPLVTNLVVLNESENERQANFEWLMVEKYRVLLLGNPAANEVEGLYRAKVFRKDGSTAINPEDMNAPSYAGRTMSKIPFVVCNATDIVMTPAKPPLKGLADIALTIYRGEADYRQHLHTQGQDTLVTTGANFGDDEDVRVGAGARLDLPNGATAEYIGVGENGLTEQREALTADKGEATELGGTLIQEGSNDQQSGDALKVRVSARTASLNQIALTGATALEMVLKDMAVWVGADPNKVKITPNLDFDAAPLTGPDLLGYVSAKNMGAPLARETIHDLMRARNITKLSYEEEMAKIDDEEPMGPTITLPAKDGENDPPAGGAE